MIHGQPITIIFSVVVVHVMSSDFKNHLVLPFLPFPCKTGPLWSGDVVERVFECVSFVAFHEIGLLLQ